MKNDCRQRGQLQSPYGLLTLAPQQKKGSIQYNINMASELISPSGLSKQWGPPYTITPTKLLNSTSTSSVLALATAA